MEVSEMESSSTKRAHDHFALSVLKPRSSAPATGKKKLKSTLLKNVTETFQAYIEEKQNLVRWLYRIRNTKGHRFGFLQPAFIKIIFGDGLFGIPIHTPLATLSGPNACLWSMASNENLLYSGFGDSTIRVWDMDTDTAVSTLAGHGSGAVTCLCIRGNVLYSGCADRTIRVWDLESGECIAVFEGHHRAVLCLGIYSSKTHDMYAVSGSSDGTIRVWDVKTQAQLTILRLQHPATSDRPQAVNCLAIYGDIVYAGDNDGLVQAWNLKTFEHEATFAGHSSNVRSILVKEQKSSTPPVMMISGSSDQTIIVWDLHAHLVLHVLHGHSGSVTSLLIVHARLYSGSSDHDIYVWDTNTFECVAILEGNCGPVLCMTAHGHGRRLYPGSDNGTIRVWSCSEN